MNWDAVAAKGKLAGAVMTFPTPHAHDNRDRGGPSMPCIQRRVEKGKQIMLSQTEDGGSTEPDVGRVANELADKLDSNGAD